MHQTRFWGIIFACLMLFATALLLFSVIRSPVSSADLSMSADILSSPDLTVQLLMEPSNPQVGQQVLLTVQVTNQGTALAREFCSYLYVDPSNEPPNVSTPYLYDNCMHASLYPGYSYSWSKPYTFTLEGRHYVFAWVDKDNAIAESDETNNTDEVIFTIGSIPTPDPNGDTYEPDNSCGGARRIWPDGVHYRHNLWPVGDEDWVRIDMVQGVQYIITTSNVGEDGDTKIELYDLCSDDPVAGDDPVLGPGAQLTWQAMFTGPHYVQVTHHNTTYGPDTRYDLSVRAQVNGDSYEPNDTCETARIIVPGSGVQPHLFFRAGDEDWLRFQAIAGQDYQVALSNIGPAAQPQLSLYRFCGDSMIGQANPGAGLSWTCTQSGEYYLRVQDAVTATHGILAYYSLELSASGNGNDPGEPNNTPANARAISTDGTPQTRNIAPASDVDWFYFDAQAGQDYRINTFDLGPAGDTVICLYERDALSLVTCDDDSGPGLASRLWWECTESGRYYLKVHDYRQDAGGTRADYNLSVHAGAPVCDTDTWANDDFYHRAQPITTDGVWQSHNICPDNDVDWVSFWTPAQRTYAIETAHLGTDADTLLSLYDRDGQTLLGYNDDSGAGRESRILWNFTQEGVYYVKAESFGATGSGQGTQYDLRVIPSTLAPTPTPTPSPTPTMPPPPEVLPSSAHTLILTNREQLVALYGTTAVDEIMYNLAFLSSHPTVKGVVVDVSADPAAANAYTLWLADPQNNTKANLVSEAVRDIVLQHRRSSPNLTYLVLVGDDRVIPFRRVADRAYLTQAYESLYAHAPVGSTVRAAQLENMSLNDDFYAASRPTIWDGQLLYIPDLAVGRLVEGPDDILSVIHAFFSAPTVTVNRALVVGYSAFLDGSQRICSHWSDAGVSGLNCELVSQSWTWGAPDLKARHLDATPRFDLQALGILTTHFIEGSPTGSSSRIYASDIAASSANLNGTLIWNAGAYSGLNVPGSAGNLLDLPEAFAGQGVNYIGNTGVTLVNSAGTGQVERLMVLLAQELTAQPQVKIGQAWLQAKQRYYREAAMFTEYDRKVLSVATLYGLPMAAIQTDGYFGDNDPFPSVNLTQTITPTALGDVISTTVNLSLSEGIASLGENEGVLGDYYDLDGSVYFGPNAAAQPYFYAPPGVLGDELSVRSMVWTGGIYTDVINFDPVRATPLIVGEEELLTQSTQVEPELWRQGWSPTRMGVFNGMLGDSFGVLWGQYDEDTHTERIYSNLSFDFYFGDSLDWTPPEVAWVAGRAEGPSGHVKVLASDPSGVQRVVVVYTHNDGSWHNVELRYDPATEKWTGVIPTWRPVTWFAEVIDGAGNKATLDNKGHYYHLQEVQAIYAIYLPLVMKAVWYPPCPPFCLE